MNNEKKIDLIVFGVSMLLLIYSVTRIPELFGDNKLSIFLIIVIIGFLVSYMSNSLKR